LNGSIDSIQENTGKDWTAMGFRSADCLLYGLSNIVTSPMLSSVDPVSGAVVDIFSYENHQFYAGEYDNENDLFYAVGIPEINSGSLSDQLLYTINPVTGALDTIGNLNLTAIDGFSYTPDNGINGLAFNPDLDVLYGITDNGKLYQINPSNAAISLIGNTISGMRGLAYDEIEDKLWAISPSATLVEIDKLTGAQIGSVLCEETFGNVTSLTFVSGTCGENTTCNDALLIEFSDCNQPEPEEDSIPEIQAPNVFTPGNGDEVNDLYFLNTKNIHSLQLTIYNRWGNILFKEESNDLINDNPSWDGGAAPEGVYFYCYEAKGNNGQIIEGKGFLHLLR
jgi:gliding motility-associated-like protein